MTLTRCSLLLLALATLPQWLPAQGKIELPVSLSELQKRVVADSNDPAAHYNVALGYWNAKKWDDVNRELHAAIALDPRFAEAHLALAYLPFARDQHMLDGLTHIDASTPKNIVAALDQQTREFRHAFLIDPMVDMRIIAANTTSVDYWLVRDDLGDADDATYLKGLANCQEGDYADCENDLAAYMQAFGNSKNTRSFIPETALWYHGIAAAHQQHYDAAIKDFTQLINRDSTEVAKLAAKALIRFPIRTNEYRYFIGVFQQAGGHPDEAIATYQQAIEKDLSLYIAHVRLAEIYEGRKDFDHAIAERRDAINANPDDASLQIDLGVTLGRAGKFADARDALATATHALPRSVDAWFWLGIANQQLGQKAEAVQDFTKVVALAPSRMAARAAQAKQHLAALQ